MKEILINIEDWALCKHTEDHPSFDVCVYAEHVTGCSEPHFASASAWGWEYDDGMGVEGYEACWKCATRVPKELVGLVLMYNWSTPGRHDNDV